MRVMRMFNLMNIFSLIYVLRYSIRKIRMRHQFIHAVFVIRKCTIAIRRYSVRVDVISGFTGNTNEVVVGCVFFIVMLF